MSESERLAQLQAQSGGGVGSQRGSSTVGSIGTNANLVNGNAGYGKVKSWETSSKWGSQSEFDHTGKTKSSSYLLTGEGEDETLNGKTSSYKAATATLEQDGKRSTYSIHTP